MPDPTPIPDLALPNGRTIPSAQVRNFLWSGEQAGKAWLVGLPGIITGVCNRWEITLSPELPLLSYNLVLFGTSPRLGDIVLKLSPPHDEVTAEIVAIGLAPSTVSPRLFDADPDAAWSLQERVSPGTTLESKVKTGEIDDIEATRIAADICLAYWRPIEPTPSLFDMKRWCQALYEFEVRHAHPSRLMPVAWVRTAIKHFEFLLSQPRESVLLHGDLHHGNILVSDTHGWELIDPKGVRGERGFDVGAWLYNPIGIDKDPDIHAITDRRLTQLASHLDIDRFRLWQCALVMCILSDCWNAEGGDAEDLSCQSIIQALLDMPEARVQL